MAFRGPGAVVWRDHDGLALPWPSRAEAFMDACAQFAGRREKDLVTALKDLGESVAEATQKIPTPNPARGR